VAHSSGPPSLVRTAPAPPEPHRLRTWIRHRAALVLLRGAAVPGGWRWRPNRRGPAWWPGVPGAPRCTRATPQPRKIGSLVPGAPRCTGATPGARYRPPP